MRNFCGLLPKIDTRNAPDIEFYGKNMGDIIRPLWVEPPYREQSFLRIKEKPYECILIGNFFAKKEEIKTIFYKCIKNSNYTELITLPGNYNLIVHENENTLIFSDITGLKPVFFTDYNNQFIAYSSSSLILQQLINAEINTDWISKFLICPGIQELLQDQSPFQNIKCILPGHFLFFSPNKTQYFPYWIPPPGEKNITDVSNKLKTHLLMGINNRVSMYGENMSADLSGGLDSTSLSVLAAKMMDKKGQTLNTITYGSTSEREDTIYAQKVASKFANINSNILGVHEFPSAFSNLEIPLTDEPLINATTFGNFYYGFNFIKAMNSELHLSGEGADAVLLSPYSYLADLILKRKIKTLFSHINGWAKVKNISQGFLIKSAFMLSITKYQHWAKKQSINLQRNQNKQNIFELGWFQAPQKASWHTDEAVRVIVSLLKTHSITGIPFSEKPGQHEAYSNILAIGRTSRVLQQVAGAYDVNLDFPYLDAMIVDTCLQAKTEDRNNPFLFKPLLYHSLKSDIPEFILSRTTKGDYTDDLYKGIQKNLNTVINLFQESYLHNLGLICSNTLIEAAKTFNMGLDVGLCQFCNTVAAELWIRNIKSNQQQYWRKKYVANKT